MVEIKLAPTPGGRVGDDSPVGTPGGRQNWVDKAGGLPRYIRMIAHALIRKGMGKSHAIATAINRVRHLAATSDDPKVKAAAAEAYAEFQAKAKSTRARSGTKGLLGKLRRSTDPDPGGRNVRDASKWPGKKVGDPIGPRHPVDESEPEDADNDPADTSYARLKRLLHAARDKTTPFGEQMKAVRKVGPIWDRAEKTDAIEAVPLNEWRMDETADELSQLDESDNSWREFMDLMDYVKGYGFYDYQPVNARLRSGKGDVHAAILEDLVPELRSIPAEDSAAVVTALDTLLERSALTDDIVVYRGLGSHMGLFGDVGEGGIVRADLANKGFTWTDDAFVSTATDEATTREFTQGEQAELRTLESDRGGDPVLLRILVPKGVRALHRGERDGDEVILDRGLTFQVWKTYQEYGVPVVEAIVVGDRYGQVQKKRRFTELETESASRRPTMTAEQLHQRWKPGAKLQFAGRPIVHVSRRGDDVTIEYRDPHGDVRARTVNATAQVGPSTNKEEPMGPTPQTERKHTFAELLEHKRRAFVRTAAGELRYPGKKIGDEITPGVDMDEAEVTAQFGKKLKDWNYGDTEHIALHEHGDVVIYGAGQQANKKRVFAGLSTEEAAEVADLLDWAHTEARDYDPAAETAIEAEPDTHMVDSAVTTNGLRVGYDITGNVVIGLPGAGEDEGKKGLDEHEMPPDEAQSLAEALTEAITMARELDPPAEDDDEDDGGADADLDDEEVKSFYAELSGEERFFLATELGLEEKGLLDYMVKRSAKKAYRQIRHAINRRRSQRGRGYKSLPALLLDE